jgi:hypothetical protein
MEDICFSLMNHILIQFPLLSFDKITITPGILRKKGLVKHPIYMLNLWN